MDDLVALGIGVGVFAGLLAISSYVAILKKRLRRFVLRFEAIQDKVD